MGNMKALSDKKLGAKKLVLLVWAMLAANATATAQIAKLMHFSGVVAVSDGADKTELQRRVRLWLQETMPEETLKKNTGLENVISGTSCLKYASNVAAASNMTQGSVIYDFEITAGNDRVSYVFTNFRHEGKIKFHAITDAQHFPHKIQTVEKPWYDLVWRDIKQQLGSQVPQLAETLAQAAKDDQYTAKLNLKAKHEAARLTGQPASR